MKSLPYPIRGRDRGPGASRGRAAPIILGPRGSRDFRFVLVITVEWSARDKPRSTCGHDDHHLFVRDKGEVGHCLLREGAARARRAWNGHAGQVWNDLGI